MAMRLASLALVTLSLMGCRQFVAYSAAPDGGGRFDGPRDSVSNADTPITGDTADAVAASDSSEDTLGLSDLDPDGPPTSEAGADTLASDLPAGALFSPGCKTLTNLVASFPSAAFAYYSLDPTVTDGVTVARAQQSTLAATPEIAAYAGTDPGQFAAGSQHCGHASLRFQKDSATEPTPYGWFHWNQPLAEGTVAFYVKFREIVPDTSQGLLSHDAVDYPTTPSHLTIVLSGQGRLALRLQSTAADTFLCSDSALVRKGVWHHVMASWKEGAAPLLAVDGKLASYQGADVVVGRWLCGQLAAQTGVYNSSLPWALGANLSTRSGTTNHPWSEYPLDGEMSELELSDIALLHQLAMP